MVSEIAIELLKDSLLMQETILFMFAVPAFIALAYILIKKFEREENQHED